MGASGDWRGRKILVVAHQYWPTPGSAAQVIGALVRELRSRGASVTVLTSADAVGAPPRAGGRRRGANGERRLTGTSGETVLLVTPAEVSGVSLKRIFHLARFALAVLLWTGRLRPHLIVSDPPPTAAWSASLAGRLSRFLSWRRGGRPFVYYFSDSWSEVTKDAESRTARILHGVVTRLENQVLARAALVVGVTGDLKRLAQQSGAVRVIGVANGIDTEMFTDQGDTWSPVGGNGPFFLYAGNAGLVHGAHVFVDAAVRLWQGGWSFDLVHMGYGADRFLERSAELEPWSDRIFVLGNQPAELVAAAYRGALGALSSLRPLPHYAHARPMKTMSGLACGCPAVYAGEGEFADAVRSAGLGYVQKWSVDGAELAMREALTQEASDGHQLLRSRCRQYAVSHFEERHGARIVCSAMHEVWGETVQ